jgi:hypothetical protein
MSSAPDKPRYDKLRNESPDTVWVVVDDGTIYDVIAFSTYTDAARFKAVVPENRSGPWRCPIMSYPRGKPQPETVNPMKADG